MTLMAGKQLTVENGDVTEAEDGETPTWDRCPACGDRLERGEAWRHCPWCGEAL